MTTTDQNTYGSILKAIGLFGGVKIFQIIIGIIKNKIVALLLGPSGMGIVGLITSNTQLVKSLTDFGLHTSSIREISKSYTSGDKEKTSRTLSIFRKLVIITGFLGSLVVFSFAEHLSQISFNNHDYTSAFRLVSITLFLDQICMGQTALMQGTFHYKLMARSSLFGSIIGLVVSIPMYYLWGVKAIVPVIILSSLTALVLSWYFSKKIEIKKTTVSYKDAIIEGRGMLVLGLAIAIAAIARVGKAYGLRIFISHLGGIAEVGLFTAGMTISTQYVDVILSSMGSDYSPRLAAIVDNHSSFIDVINRQIRLMCALLLPLMVIFIVFIKEVVILLYSQEFLAIECMVTWMMFSMFLRAISWCLSFPLIAIGNSKLFLANELSSEIYSLIFSILGFYYLSFEGLGLAFFITQLCYAIQMFYVAYKYFDFKLTLQNQNSMCEIVSILITLYIVLCFLKGTIWGYSACLLIFLICIHYTYKQMKDMVDIKSFIQSSFIKKHDKNNQI